MQAAVARVRVDVHDLSDPQPVLRLAPERHVEQVPVDPGQLRVQLVSEAEEPGELLREDVMLAYAEPRLVGQLVLGRAGRTLGAHR